jgi:hypothetical protein
VSCFVVWSGCCWSPSAERAACVDPQLRWWESLVGDGGEHTCWGVCSRAGWYGRRWESTDWTHVLGASEVGAVSAGGLSWWTSMLPRLSTRCLSRRAWKDKGRLYKGRVCCAGRAHGGGRNKVRRETLYTSLGRRGRGVKELDQAQAQAQELAVGWSRGTLGLTFAPARRLRRCCPAVPPQPQVSSKQTSRLRRAKHLGTCTPNTWTIRTATDR